MSDDQEEDPFEKLDESVGDREGDPFERLGEKSEEPADTDQANSPAQAAEENETAFTPDSSRDEPADREDTFGTDQMEAASQTGTTESAEDTASEPAGASGKPSAEVETESGPRMNFGVDRRESAGPGKGPALSGVESREGDPYDGVEQAFAEMEIDELDPDQVWQELASAESRGSVGDVYDRGYADVSKHSYCEDCEHFSEPPDVHCTHEGTEIVEFLDMETVRVVDCPIVAAREELEEGN